MPISTAFGPSNDAAFRASRRRGFRFAKMLFATGVLVFLATNGRSSWRNEISYYLATSEASAVGTKQTTRVSSGEKISSSTASTPVVGTASVGVEEAFEEGIEDGSEEDHANNHPTRTDDSEWSTSLWPKLRQRLCPNNVPDVSLGPSLFRIARTEFGLDANATASGDDRNRERTADVFYNGYWGTTIFIDGFDPRNTVLYASIWKCANNQIHNYLRKLFNRRNDNTVKYPSDPTVGHANDTLLVRIKKNELNYLFHEAYDRFSESSGEPGRDDASFDVEDGSSQRTVLYEDDSQQHYFNFNDTSRTKPCVFAVVRDPISHFLSGYNEVEYRLIRGVEDAPLDPDRLASYTTIPIDNVRHREERFVTFVRNLLKEHRSFAKYPFYQHVAAMSRILPTLSKLDLIPRGRGGYGAGDRSGTPMRTASSVSDRSWYLPTLENLTETFPGFLAQACPRMASNYYRQQHPPSSSSITSGHTGEPFDDGGGVGATSGSSPPPPLLPPMKALGGHPSQKDPLGTYRAAKDVWERGGTVSRALCVLHAVDYACFPDGLVVPPICRDVYSGDSFLEGILPGP